MESCLYGYCLPKIEMIALWIHFLFFLEYSFWPPNVKSDSSFAPTVGLIRAVSHRPPRQKVSLERGVSQLISFLEYYLWPRVLQFILFLNLTHGVQILNLIPLLLPQLSWSLQTTEPKDFTWKEGLNNLFSFLNLTPGLQKLDIISHLLTQLVWSVQSLADHWTERFHLKGGA